MKRETLLTISVIALLVLNIGTLGFLFFWQPPHERPEGPRQLDRKIIKTLSLNPDQVKQFETLKTAHHEQMVQCERDFRRTLEQYFALLNNETIDAAQQDSLQNQLSRIQLERARTTFRHFQDLKALCTAEQQKDFGILLPDLMQVILPPRPNAPHPR